MADKEEVATTAAAPEKKENEEKTEEPEMPAMPQMKISQILPLVVMMGLGKFDLDQMGYRHYAEAVFGLVQVICLGVIFMMYQKINAMEETGAKIHVPEVKSMGQVVTPAIDQTPKEYDVAKIKEQGKQAVMSAVILSGVYYKWQYLMPVVLQVLMTPVQLYESPLFQLHMMNSKDVKRPFPAANPFGLPAAPEAAAPAAVKEETEKKSD